jgi:hypothetical protein
MKRFPETIGIVADLHCGSRWGLYPKSKMPPDTPEAVRWLWSCWEWLIENWPPLDLLILNGDEIDGKQGRAASTGLWNADLSAQVDYAIECLEPLVKKARKVIRQNGTGYHVSTEQPLRQLDEHFRVNPTDAARSIVRDIQLADGAILNVKHQPEGEGTLYRGTGLDREVLWACLSETVKGLPKATHLIRSHLHSSAHLRGFGKEINFTPGWCLQQPYALHKRRYRWMPDIGATLLVRDPLGFHGYRVVTKTFDLPRVEAEPYAAL